MTTMADAEGGVNPADEVDMSDLDWNKAVVVHNLRLADLDKEGKLTTDDVFDQNDMRDGVKAFMADWIKKEHGRDCRDADGKIDFDTERADGDHCWSSDALILAALIPLVIETCGVCYCDSVRGSTEFLAQKLNFISKCLKSGQYCDVRRGRGRRHHRLI
jgi:hypothetical protein